MSETKGNTTWHRLSTHMSLGTGALKGTAGHQLLPPGTAGLDRAGAPALPGHGGHGQVDEPGDAWHWQLAAYVDLYVAASRLGLGLQDRVEVPGAGLSTAVRGLAPMISGISLASGVVFLLGA